MSKSLTRSSSNGTARLNWLKSLTWTRIAGNVNIESAIPSTVQGVAIRRLTFIFGLGLATSACAPEPQVEYTLETETNFLAGCISPASDSGLHVRLCQCVNERMRVVIPYERLKVLDDEMLADPELKLQPEFVELIADCVIEEGELNR